MSESTSSRENRWLGRITHAAGAATLLLVLAGAYLLNSLYVALLYLLPMICLVAVPAALWRAIRGRLTLDFVRHPFARATRPLLFQFLNRTLCFVSVAIAITLAAPVFMFTGIEYVVAMSIFAWVPAALLIVMGLFPPPRPSRSINFAFLVIWGFLAIQFWTLFITPISSEKVTLHPPFDGDWIVFQGGRSSLLNHHYFLTAQRHALDLVVPDRPASKRGEADPLESYATFGQPYYSPADGTVIRVTNDRPDQKIGTSDDEFVVGNHVVIEMQDGWFVLLAHLQAGSATVSEGETVSAGQLIGRCGNSGNTSEPHLHIQVQNRPDWQSPDLETLPIVFDGIDVIRWGRKISGDLGELRRNDRIIVRMPRD